jgi:hypothetical protein
MTQPTINPYEPIPFRAPPLLSIEPLTFDGVIESADYREMLPRDQEWWLCLVLSIMLAICILIFGSVTVVLAISSGRLLLAVGVSGFWTLMLAALWFLKRRISSADRASRMLKKNPDVLGSASGVISDSGVVFRDGVRTWWFGPQHHKHTAILRSGIRLHVEGSTYRYLALSARIFECYSIEQARGLKRRWTEHAGIHVGQDSPVNAELLNRVGVPPIDAIHFKGQVITEISMRTPAIRNRAIADLLAYLSIPVLALFFRERLETWVFWVSMLFVVYGLATNFRMWLYYFSRTFQQSQYHYGWIDEQEFATFNNTAAVRMPLAEIALKTDSQDLVVLILKGGQPYQLPRHLVASEKHWNRLRAIQVGTRESKRME